MQLLSSVAGAEQAQGAFGDLNSTGVVEFPNVEVGNYTVLIFPPAPLDPDPTKRSPPSKDYSNIPSKFRNQLTSTLKADVAEGPNKFTFELKL